MLTTKSSNWVFVPVVWPPCKVWVIGQNYRVSSKLPNNQEYGAQIWALKQQHFLPPRKGWKLAHREMLKRSSHTLKNWYHALYSVGYLCSRSELWVAKSNIFWLARSSVFFRVNRLISVDWAASLIFHLTPCPRKLLLGKTIFAPG